MKHENSLKTRQLNSILEKLSQSGKISMKEKSFLDSFEEISDKEFGEFSMLTASEAESKIEYLIDIGIEVICNICDELGPIGYKVISIIKEDRNHLQLEKNYTLELKQNCFYDLRYDIQRLRFYLESNSEYYELVPVNND
jgi:hypothetical protein